MLLFDGLLGGYQLETTTAESVCGLLAEEELFYFPGLLLLTTLLLLSALHLIVHARECLLICLAFIVKLSEFVFDSIEVDMGGKNKLVLFIQLLIDLFELLLKLLDVLLRVWVHLLEDRLGPLECIDLIGCPVGGRRLELDLGLDDVELFLEFLEFTVVDLHTRLQDKMSTRIGFTRTRAAEENRRKSVATRSFRTLSRK